MRAFARALGDERTGITVPWRSLAGLMEPLPGYLVIILGAPGVGKSMLTLVWALTLARQGIPTSLVSLDTDSRTQGARVVAHLKELPFIEVLHSPLAHLDFIRELDYPMQVFDRQVTPREIPEILEAGACYLGESPHLLVVDDTSKLVVGQRDFDGYDEAFARVHQAARRYGSVAVTLHHLRRGTGGASRKNNAGTRPVNLDDGRYTGEYEAEIVLGVWRPYPNILRVGLLKNRNGQSDPNGALFVDLVVDWTTVQITDPLDWSLGVPMDEIRLDEELWDEEEWGS